MTTASNQDGFTLLEVLVAFSILVVGLAAIYQVFLGGLRNEQIAKQDAIALLLAQSRLAAIGVSEPLAPSAGDVDNGFAWRIDVAPYANGMVRGSPQTGGAAWITATVTWEPTTGGKRRSISLTALKLVPPQ